MPESMLRKTARRPSPGGFFFIAGGFFRRLAGFAIFLIQTRPYSAQCVSARVSNRLYNVVKASFGEIT